MSTIASQTGVMAHLLFQVSRSSLMAHDAPAVWRPQIADFREITGQSHPSTFAMMILLISLLQALTRPGVTVWIGLYRQAFAVGFFTWLLVDVFGLGTRGVWFGFAFAVLTGLAVALAATQWISRPLMGGLFRARPDPAPAPAG